MRNLWARIGLGAGFVFVAGLFFISLGRQVKASVLSTIQDGGRVRVPLSLVPFRVDHRRVGSIQGVDVQRGPDAPKRINFTVRLRDHVAAQEFADCLFVVDRPSHEGMVSCLPADAPDADGYLQIGRVDLTPGDLSRPLLVTRQDAEEWLDAADLERVNISATEAGTIIKVTKDDGTRLVDLRADSNGALLHVRDASGKEVVRLTATPEGVQLKVKKGAEPPKP